MRREAGFLSRWCWLAGALLLSVAGVVRGQQTAPTPLSKGFDLVSFAAGNDEFAESRVVDVAGVKTVEVLGSAVATLPPDAFGFSTEPMVIEGLVATYQVLVPEPGTGLVFGGLLAMGVWRRRV